jgi:transposase
MGRARKSDRTELTAAKRAKIWTRYCDGHGYTAISRLEKTPYSTVRSIVERTLKSGDTSFESKPRHGASKKTSDRDDRALVRHAIQNPKDTLYALATPSKSGHKLGRTTVRKILKAYGKAKRKPRKKPYLKPEHKYKRLIWCKQQKKAKRNYRMICWSDEVTFHVGEDGNTVYVTRGPGEEYEEKNLKPSFKSGRTSVGVWSCFCGTEMGPLVIIEKGGRMNACRYLETLREHFIPFYHRMVEKYGPGVVMQEDNAPWHTAKVVRKYMTKQGIPRLQWPPQSPDLSPIENLWKQIKDMISKRRHRIKNIGMMERALEEVWPQIKPETLEKLNASMEKRINACIRNKGGPTKY